MEFGQMRASANPAWPCSSLWLANLNGRISAVILFTGNGLATLLPAEAFAFLAAAAVGGYFASWTH